MQLILPRPQPSLFAPTVAPQEDYGAIVQQYYTALAALDVAALVACHAPNARWQGSRQALCGRDNIEDAWLELRRRIKRSRIRLWNVRLYRLSYDVRYASARFELEYGHTPDSAGTRIITDDEFVFDRDGLIANHVQNIDLWSIAQSL